MGQQGLQGVRPPRAGEFLAQRAPTQQRSQAVRAILQASSTQLSSVRGPRSAAGAGVARGKQVCTNEMSRLLLCWPSLLLGRRVLVTILKYEYQATRQPRLEAQLVPQAGNLLGRSQDALAEGLKRRDADLGLLLEVG